MAKMIKDVEIRQATAEDIKVFYPDGSPRTCYAWVALYKGKMAAMAGVIVERYGAVVFSDVLPHEAPKATAWKTIIELYKHIEALGLPFMTAVEPCNTKSKKLFEKLGMIYVGNRNGKDTYKCHQ